MDSTINALYVFHSAFQKNIKETQEELSFYFQYSTVRIFSGISILASFYLVQSLGI